MKQMTPHLLRTALLAGALALSGCAHVGPRTIPVDRFDYSKAIADSWKEQTLLNIVKLRYMDLPVFVDVSSIVSGYSLQTTGNIGGTVSSEAAIQGNFLSAGAGAVYTDRPTITYVPMTGEKFLRSLFTPIDPKNVFFLLQSGYPADFVLGLTVESLNGVRNRSAAAGVVREADPDFLTAIRLIREVQAAGAVGMRVHENKATGATGVIFFRGDDMPADIAVKTTEIRRLLRLRADQQQFTLIYSPARGADGELAVNSRSMLQILGTMASYIEVPAEHEKARSATPGIARAPGDSAPEVVRIRSGKEQPTTAYVSVKYRGYWFWIDDDDYRTKRAMTAIMVFFTLTDTGGNERLPLVTIPAQ